LKKSNAWGLLDMHGNVWEWCGDWYDAKLPGGSDPEGPTTGSIRLYRGGCWTSTPKLCRSAFRNGDAPSFRSFYLGFRLALSPSGS
jgi:formylglycine-generating enzyme required for sulfatase activity